MWPGPPLQKLGEAWEEQSLAQLIPSPDTVLTGQSWGKAH